MTISQTPVSTGGLQRQLLAALALALLVLPGSVDPAAAASSEACYRDAAQCTARCRVYDYACFAGCDVILDLCLPVAGNTGTLDPGTGTGPVKPRFPGQVAPLEGVLRQ